MTKNSTMRWSEYLIDILVTALIALIAFHSTIFRCLPNTSWFDSAAILWGLVMVFALLGTFLIFRKMRTGLTATLCAILPLGWYTTLTYLSVARLLILWLIGLSLLGSVCFGIYNMTRKMPDRVIHKKHIIRRRLSGCFAFSQSSLAVAFLAIMVVLGFRSVFGPGLVHASVAPAKQIDGQEITIEANIEEILILDNEAQWKKSSVKDKLNVLQICANIEARYLGIHELTVGAADLPNGTLAGYSENTHTISLDLNHLEQDAPRDLLDSLLHEAHHSYQHCLVQLFNKVDVDMNQLLLFEDAATYAAELADYKKGSDGFQDYYNQQFETDARAYAKERALEYYIAIHAYYGIILLDIE